MFRLFFSCPCLAYSGDDEQGIAVPSEKSHTKEFPSCGLQFDF